MSASDVPVELEEIKLVTDPDTDVDTDTEEKPNSSFDSENKDLENEGDLDEWIPDRIGVEQSDSSEEDEDPAPDEGNESRARSIGWGGWSTEGRTHTFPFNKTPTFNIGSAESPIDFFNLVFNSSFMNTLASSINTHALNLMLDNTLPTSRILEWKDTNVEEVQVYLALLIHMGHIRTNRLNDYWSTDLLFSLPFKNYMSRDRFMLLHKNLWFTDSDSDDYNHLSQFLKPLNNFFNTLMADLVSPSKNLIIDENIHLYWHGSGETKEHLKGPTRYYQGVKINSLTDTNCLTQKIHITTHDEERKNRRSHVEGVVMALMKDYLNEGHSIYATKYFTSVPLAEKLLAQGTYLTGTLKPNKCTMPIASNVEKGTLIVRYNESGVCLTNYRDKKNHYVMISTEHRSNFVTYSHRKHIVSQTLEVIVQYDKHMKFLDTKNQMLREFPFHNNKMTKWYKKVMLHIFQIMLLNSYIMFNEHTKVSRNARSFYDFRIEVVRKLLQVKTSTKSPEMIADTDKRAAKGRIITTTFGDAVHLPELLPKNKKGKTMRKDCRHCFMTRNKRKASIFHCPLCYRKPGLCLKCFREYHKY